MRKWQGMKWLNLIFHGEKSIDLMLRTENNNINFSFPPRDVDTQKISQRS